MQLRTATPCLISSGSCPGARRAGGERLAHESREDAVGDGAQDPPPGAGFVVVDDLVAPVFAEGDVTGNFERPLREPLSKTT